MYHSINIGNKNTWDDWHIVSKSRPHVALPEIKTNYVDVSGIDGGLDLTLALTGYPLYKNREGSWDFVIDWRYEGKNWEVLYHTISNYLAGRKFKIVLEDDPYYYYLGRCWVEEWKPGDDWSNITINYYLDSYKYEINSAGEDWLWDPFSFETGIIREYGWNHDYHTGNYKKIVVSGPTVVKIPTSTRPSVPVITASGSGMTVTFKGYTFPELHQGENRIVDIIINPEDGDEAELIFNGSGEIQINYQGGWL